jgi:histidinol-phosphatase (PHP family)
MIKFDYHTHTHHSPDSGALLDDMVRRAILLGLTEYAITDHMDFVYPVPEFRNKTWFSKYIRAVLRAKEKYADKIKILLGIELGLRPDCAAIGAQIANAYDFDIIIGSMHQDTEGIDFGYAQFFSGRNKQEAYNAYFESILATIRACDCFDILGHLDYIERYGRYDDKSLHYNDHKEVIDEILKTVIDKGKGIEINTSGFAYGFDRPHPQPAILRRYKELGGEILTIGSDAHRPDAIAFGYNKSKKIMEEAGFKYITRFEKRKPSFIKISN